MTTEGLRFGAKTRRELASAAIALRDVARTIDEHRVQSRVGFSSAFRAESPAKTDHESAPQEIKDLLDVVELRTVTALDHCDAVTRLGEAAANGEPTSAFAAMSIGRSAIEALATAGWLVADDLSTHQRLSRHLSLKRDELRLLEKAGRSVNADAKRHHRNDETRLDTARENERAEVTDTAERLGIELSDPLSFSQRVRHLLGGDESVYPLMSAASHGNSWATLALGFPIQRDEDGSGGMSFRRKSPPVIAVWYPIAQSLRALVTCAWQEAGYRGWDQNRIAGAAEQAYSALDFAPDLRFWHA